MKIRHLIDHVVLVANEVMLLDLGFLKILGNPLQLFNYSVISMKLFLPNVKGSWVVATARDDQRP